MGRLKLGFLTVHGDTENHSQMMSGVFEAAETYNANVIRFAAKIFDGELDKYNTELNNLYRIIEAQNLDGLMFLGWMPGLVGDYFNDFLRRFNSIPIVSLGTGYENIPNVYAKSEMCIKELLEHMIMVHGYKRIIFVPPAVPDVRSNVYKEVMQKYGLYHEDYLIHYNDLCGVAFNDRMKRLLSILIDEREVVFDAILVMYDTDAQNLMKELKVRGISVPGDLAVASYEDTEFSNYSTPPLTTITYPWRELGYQGCEKIIKIIHKEPVEHSTPIFSKLIIRSSCGCSSNNIKFSKINSSIEDKKTEGKMDAKGISQLTDEIQNAFPYNLLNMEKLLRALRKDFDEVTTAAFLTEFEAQLQEVVYKYPYKENIDEIEQLIYYLRNLVINQISNERRTLVLFEDIILKVQVILKEKTISVIGFRQVQIKKIDQELHKVSQSLIDTFNVKELLNVLEKNLPLLEIPSCYIFRFNENSLEKCSLIFCYNKYRRTDTDSLPTAVSLHITDEFIKKHQKVLCQLLYVNNDYLGFIVFEPNLVDERIYHTLALHISSALKGAILLEHLQDEIALRKEKENQLIYIANYDSLTSLFNRRYFYLTTNNIIEEATRMSDDNMRFYLLYIDIDDFKKVNDSLGHDYGDAVLMTIARRLQAALQMNALRVPAGLGESRKEAIYRLGGDEFTALVTGVTIDEMRILANQIVRTIRSPYLISGQEISITCSVGISVFPEDGLSTEMILTYADRAMYQAKRQKDRYCFYHTGLQKDTDNIQ